MLVHLICRLAFIVSVSVHEHLIPQSLIREFLALEYIAKVTQANVVIGMPYLVLLELVVIHLHMIFEEVTRLELLLTLIALVFPSGSFPLRKRRYLLPYLNEPQIPERATVPEADLVLLEDWRYFLIDPIEDML